MRALVTLDGSTLSASILPSARRVAELVGDVEFHVLRVIDPQSVKGTPYGQGADVRGHAAGTMVIHGPRPRIAESHGEAEERVHREAVAEMEKLFEEAVPGVEAEFHVEWAKEPADAIIAKADELDADLIVMATHGRSGLTHLLAGSVAEAVIRKSNRPVLVRCPQPG